MRKSNSRTRAMRVPRRRFLRWLGRGAAAAGAVGLGGVPITNLLKGVAYASHTTQDPRVFGHWDAPFTTPIVGIHAAVLRTGKVLLLSGRESSEQAGRAVLWDPLAGTFVDKPAPDNLFCSGHCSLADGTILFIGGHKRNGIGLQDTNIFDPGSETWIERAPMTQARWYPTGTTLPNGKALAMSGSRTPGRIADTPEVYDPGTNAWQQLTGARRRLPLYPWMFVLPSGAVFNAGPNGDTKALDVAAQTWGSPLYSNEGHRGGAAPAVTYEPGKILIIGGKDPAIASAETIDLVSDPQWRYTQSMSHRRRHHNATLLADGKVLVTGGTTSGNDTSTAILAAELFDPATGTWTVKASMAIARVYHSTAFLLPDGRVAVTGTDNEFRFEIYSPPYLFQGTRPSITSPPSTVAYGGSFNVGYTTPGGTSIEKVVLIRPSTVTHSFNMDQRYVPLTILADNGSTLSVQAPANTNMAPPGYYMLFIVNNQGVPSIAPFVQLI